MKTGPTAAAGLLGTLCLALVILAGAMFVDPGQPLAQVAGRAVEEPSPLAGSVPGGALGTSSDSQFWRAVRHGEAGNVSIPDKRAAIMIQSEGDNWRAWRNGVMTVYGAWGLLVIIGALALFFVLRGRVRIDAGPSGRTIERFDGIERFAHWLSAVSFIVLALSGLNMLYGKHVLLPALGPDVFAAITRAGKYAHNFIAFAFMLGLVLMFLIWVRHNIPNRYDLIWLSKAGGLLVKGVHPPSKKFNAGQKIIFWIVILGGLSLTLSGISLLFPFQVPMFASTFHVLNVLGLGLPTDFTPMEEMQWSQLWHALAGLVMVIVILAHIYIGSVGMEGAFAAMGTGQVDENWAREHHNLWVDEVKGKTPGGRGGAPQPAE